MYSSTTLSPQPHREKYCYVNCCNMITAAAGAAIAIILELGVVLGSLLAFEVVSLIKPYPIPTIPPSNNNDDNNNHYYYYSNGKNTFNILRICDGVFAAILMVTISAAATGLAGIISCRPKLLIFAIVMMVPTCLAFASLATFMSLVLADTFESITIAYPVWLVNAVVLAFFLLALEYAWFMHVFVRARAYMILKQKAEQSVHPLQIGTALEIMANGKSDGARSYAQQTSMEPTAESRF